MSIDEPASDSAPSSLRWVFGIIMAGVAMRLLMLAIFETGVGRPAGGDDVFYIEAAKSLARGVYEFRGAPTLFRPPGYPLFLSIVGIGYGAVIAQMTLGIGCAVPLFLATRNMVASLLVVTSPFLVLFELRFLSEALFIPLLLLAFTCLYRRGWPSALAGGLLLGAAALTRETLLLLPLLAVIISPLLGRKRDLLIAAIAAYSVMTPWALRNAAVPGGLFALSKPEIGFSLWVGTWERDDAWMRRGVADVANYPPAAFDGLDRQAVEAALARKDDRTFRGAALRRIERRPVTVATTWLLRYPRQWLGTRTELATLRAPTGSPSWYVIKIAFAGLNVVTIVLGLLGAIGILRRRERTNMLWLLPIAYHALIYVPVHNTEVRYTLPAIPFLLISAAFFLRDAATWWRHRSSVPSPFRPGYPIRVAGIEKEVS